MPTPNYSFEKRQREIAKKKEQEAKQAKKRKAKEAELKTGVRVDAPHRPEGS